MNVSPSLVYSLGAKMVTLFLAIQSWGEEKSFSPARHITEKIVLVQLRVRKKNICAFPFLGLALPGTRELNEAGTGSMNGRNGLEVME